MFRRFWGGLGGARRNLFIILGLLLLIAVTIQHIGSKPAGLGPSEKSAITQSADIHQIIAHPLNAPHNLVLLGAHSISPNRVGGLRLASYIYACLFFGAFFYLARGWFGKTIGILSTLVFCLSPLFLIPARLGSAEIMFFWPIVLMALYQWLAKTSRPELVLYLLLLTCGLAIYTPGLIWWLIGAGILCRRQILPYVIKLKPAIAASGLLLFILLILPAGLAAAHDWHFIEDIAALPQSWPGPVRLIKNLVWMILALGVKTPHHSPLLIGNLPLLDLIQLGLFVFGAHAMWSAARPKATAFGLNVLLAVVLAALNDNISLLLIGLPALGILVAAGLRYLYIEWRSIFPRNPIPKSLAMILMTVLVAIQLVYGLDYSLVAWPHTPDTKSVYVLK